MFARTLWLVIVGGATLINQAPPEDSEPVYTVPDDRSSFSATITMAADTEGTWTVWGLIPATECGDSAILTVTGALPNTAVAQDGQSWLSAVGLLLIALSLLGARRRSTVRKHR